MSDTTEKSVILAGSGSASANLTIILQEILQRFDAGMSEQLALAVCGLLVPTLYAVLVKVQKWIVS